MGTEVHGDVIDELPLLYTMLIKVLGKGNEVHCVGTHSDWVGRISRVELVGPSKGFKVNTINVAVVTASGREGSFTVNMPDRWKLGKDGNRWCLWPPRAARPDQG